MKYLFIMFSLWLASTGLLSGQEYRVSGIITDLQGNALPGVSVIEKGTANGTYTDEQGRYSLSLTQGQHVLQYSFLVPRPVERRLEVSRDTTLHLQLTEKDIMLDEVLVAAIRVDPNTPVTYSDLDKEEIAPRNLGQDIPVLMNFLPAVVTTTDAGAGIGYTGLRVRGSDATRINVTINGIPYNDAESQGTFWVNMPDFVSSVESLQLQRGVGTSTNGASAFGASLNLLTDGISQLPSATLQSSAGSFNTFRTTLKFDTGLMKEHFGISGRLSQIQSDGYIDRASSRLRSYFLQGSYVDNKTLVKALLFGGREITYQAWYGIEDPEVLKNSPTFNYAGAIYDEDGQITDFYDNEVDHYHQHHFQLHLNRELAKNWQGNLALHYTRGRGYFEQYKQDEYLADYGLEPFDNNGQLQETTDLIRRRWLDNDFYGTTFSLNYDNTQTGFILGGAWNRYLGDHFGEVIWAEYAPGGQYRDRYYEDDSEKQDLSFYAKFNFRVWENTSVYADAQYRGVSYRANGNDTGWVDDEFHFFNPKFGITQRIGSSQQLYLSYARAHREPNRNDYESGSPKPERLNDFELGWRYHKERFQWNANVYYMRYKDQLVLTGELNDVGAPLRRNVGDSYRLGLELDARWLFSDQLEWRPNIALSQNKNLDYVELRDGALATLGDTDIAYSPSLVAGSVLNWSPAKDLQFGLLSKWVSRQYLSNANIRSAVLDAYFINDVSVQYQYRPKKYFKEVTFNVLVNNIFDQRYISNGYYYAYDVPDGQGGVSTIDGSGYYPQAGINYLAGLRFDW